MSDKENKPAATKRLTWGTVRKELLKHDQATLIELIKKLYDSSKANRDFIHANCFAEEAGEATMASYRRKIVDQFFPARGFGKLKLSVARKAIRDYGKATGNIFGIAELMMIYVENGAQFTCQYGDIDERFYSSVESVLEEFAELLRAKDRSLYPKFKSRLEKIEQLTENIGWGFHDYISEVVWSLEKDLGDEQSD